MNVTLNIFYTYFIKVRNLLNILLLLYVLRAGSQWSVINLNKNKYFINLYFKYFIDI